MTAKKETTPLVAEPTGSWTPEAVTLLADIRANRRWESYYVGCLADLLLAAGRPADDPDVTVMKTPGLSPGEYAGAVAEAIGFAHAAAYQRIKAFAEEIDLDYASLMIHAAAHLRDPRHVVGLTEPHLRPGLIKQPQFWEDYVLVTGADVGAGGHLLFYDASPDYDPCGC